MKIPEAGNWTFESHDIAKSFDDHVREQLPWYDLASGIVFHIVRHFLPEKGTVYDIGASTGNVGVGIADILESRNCRLIAIEPSLEMKKLYKARGEFLAKKAEDVEFEPFNVAVMFLTMMFVPVAERRALISRLIEKCREGGCIIIFDRTAKNSGYMATVINRLTLSGKMAMGAEPEKILQKELSLAGCQIPYNCDHPNAVEVFRFGDFSGWVIQKGIEND
jgi:tRNA (cmo5U34)-methyltransferase